MSNMNLSAIAHIEPEVAFTRQLRGYDMVQVDRYIKKLTDAYQTAYSEYNSVCKKYTDLLEKSSELEKKAQPGGINAEIISKTLIDAEIKARNIVNSARAEAEKIKKAAFMDKVVAERSLEAANESLQQTILNLQGLVV